MVSLLTGEDHHRIALSSDYPPILPHALDDLAPSNPIGKSQPSEVTVDTEPYRAVNPVDEWTVDDTMSMTLYDDNEETRSVRASLGGTTEVDSLLGEASIED